MWNRQSPAWAIFRIIKLISAATAAVGALTALLLAADKANGLITAAIGGGAAVILTAAALIMWRRNIWHMGNGLKRRSGLLSEQEYRMSRDSITALEIKRSPLYAVFRAVRVAVYTSADGEKQAEKNSLIVSKETARRIAGKLQPMDKGYGRRYSAGHRQILIMALSEANFFSGLLFAVPLISWTVNNIDRRLSERLYYALENTGRIILPKTSPLLSSAALIPVIGWLIHLAYTFLSYGRFRFVRSGNSLMIGRGVISQRTVCIKIDNATAIEMRSTLLTRLDASSVCRITVPGYGKCVLVPAAGQRELSIETAALFPHGQPGMHIPTSGAQFWCRWWLAGAALVLILTARMAISAYQWRDVLLLCGLPVTGVLLWRAAVGACAGRTAAIRMFSDSVEITGVRGLGICRLRVLRGNIAEARLRQNPVQQSSGLCSMYIRPLGEKRGVWCRHLPAERCQALIGRLG